jgi:very-short-patch-repair endonuclease
MPERTPGAIHTSERGERQARRMRKDLSFAEAKLWKALRRLKGEGARFRKQAPFGNYIVDFVCHQARLIIEVDGGIHALAHVASRDMEREDWLKARGYVVLRVNNDEVVQSLDAVVQRITGHLGACTPTPGPSPQGGGEF